MATYKAEFLAHYYERRPRPIRAHLFGHIDRWAALASRAPRFVNAIASLRPLSRPLQSLAGIAPRRRLPRFASQTFQHWMRRHPPRAGGRPVVLWSDTFTNYFHPEVGRAAVRVLEHLGYFVAVPPQTCCGRPLYDFGLLESAGEHLQRVFEVLAIGTPQDVPIVVLEPSCFAVFQDEAGNLTGGRPIARMLAERAVLFETFLRPHFERGDLPPLAGRALVQVHCHQQALVGRDATAATLRAARLDADVLDAGCCGMAGAFGFEKDHFQVSIDIGERVLLPAIRRAADDTVVIADGFSCREQICQTTGRRASHVAEIVWQSLEGRHEDSAVT
jgi:Fe-S oxidoreductase